VSETRAAVSRAAQDVVSTIQGNVGALDLASRRGGAPTWLAAWRQLLPTISTAHADAGLGGIRVSVDGWRPTVETAPDGSFVLAGGFADSVVVRFARDEDGLDATLPAVLPMGGVLSLHDVSLGVGNGEAVASGRDLSFDGVIVDKECLGRRLVTASRHAPDGQRYVIALQDSVMVDQSGKRVMCIGVRPGDGADVDAAISANGTIEGTLVIDRDSRLREAIMMTRKLAGALTR